MSCNKEKKSTCCGCDDCSCNSKKEDNSEKCDCSCGCNKDSECCGCTK